MKQGLLIAFEKVNKMDVRIRDVFNDVCGGLSIDNKLCDKIERYMNVFISKNPEHASFFGGNLTGVYVVKFTQNDRSNWFEEILQTDEEDLIGRCNELINPVHYIVAGDVFNLSCVWLSHVILKSSKINEKRKQETMRNIYNVLQFRFITSRLQRHWPYPCSKEVAEATLAAMSNKYAIKSKGTWINVIRDRSTDIVDMKHSIHKLTIQRMDNDIRNTGESVGYLLTDTQGRNKALLKNIYGLQKQVQESGVRVNSTSATFIETDGEAVLKDKDNALETYRNYLSGVIADKPSFIKLDLVTIIESANKTMPQNMFRSTLSWVSDYYGKGDRGKMEIDEVVNKIMTHLLTYLYQNRSTMRNKSDISGLISKMKGIYTSSRTSDELLLSIRTDVEEIVKRATKIKSGPSIPATRTGVMLYLILRAFTMKHYS